MKSKPKPTTGHIPIEIRMRIAANNRESATVKFITVGKKRIPLVTFPPMEIAG